MLIIVGLGLGVASQAAADQITVSWDPSGSDVGYKVHVGGQSGSYTQHYDVGSATLFAFPTAVAGQLYCFAVSAYALSSLLEGPNSGEVCGYSNSMPTLTNPGNQTSTVGQSVSLQLVGSDPESQPLTYSATGLPAGLSLMSSTGFISGAGTTAGTSNVTVRASDGVLTVSQAFTWTMTAPAGDTTLPVATISTPTTSTSYSTTSATVNLGGTASDNVGVSRVAWASDRGSSGTATGTTSWSIAGIPLVSGTNVITISVYDAAGNRGTDSLTVALTIASDTTKPTVAIATPTSASTYSTTSATVSMGGSASDNVGVTQVRWTTDRGGSGVASGTTSWSAGVALLSGTNIVTVTATDAAGNTATATLTVTYTAPVATTTVTLQADPRKASKWRSTKLTWSNAAWSSVDVYRNGMLLTNTQNDGTYTDPIWGKGTYTYQVCAPGSTTSCSNTATVFF